MERNCAMGFLMTLLVCFCFNIANAHGNIFEEVVSWFTGYVHEDVVNSNGTAVEVAPQKAISFAGAISYSGPVYVIDHPFTETPDPKSRLLGTVQGMCSKSPQGGFSLLMAMTYSIHRGKYKGGELNVAGKHMPLREQREQPVVGGSGLFRMARGYAFSHPHSIHGPNAVIGYNVTVYHSAA